MRYGRVFLGFVWLVLLAAPVLAQADCPALVLLTGRQQQLLDVQSGAVYQTSLDDYRILDADWDNTSQAVYFLGWQEESTRDAMALYRLAWSGIEPEVLYHFKSERRVDFIEVSPDGRTLALVVETRGVETLDYGVGIALYDVETGELGAVSEVSINGETRIALTPLELEWSPAGNLLALTTIELGPEETTGLIEAACLYEEQPVCEVRLLLPDVTRGYRDPTWSPDGGLLAFRCFHTGRNTLCLWSADTEQVATAQMPFGMEQDLDWLPCGQYMVADERIAADQPAQRIVVFDLERGQRIFQVTFNDYGFNEFVVLSTETLPRWVTDEVAVTPEPGR